MLHRLCGPPSIPLSFSLAAVVPRRCAYRVGLGAEGAEPHHAYALTLTEGNLALTIAEYVLPTPTLAYVNSEWGGKMPGDTVPISGEGGCLARN